jgi:hypothetical protein
MSESVVLMDAACYRAAYSASPALATMHDMMDEKTWMEPLILVGSLWFPRKNIAPAIDREWDRHKYEALAKAWSTMSQAWYTIWLLLNAAQ